MRLYHGGVSIQGEDPKRLSGALDASPHGEASDPVPPRGKVTKVLCIEYGQYPPGLSTAQLLVVVESQGKKTTGWYKYKKIEKLRGMQKALKDFGPMWS